MKNAVFPPEWPQGDGWPGDTYGFVPVFCCSDDRKQGQSSGQSAAIARTMSIVSASAASLSSR